MLDLAVRQASHNRESLREVFQWMNRNYAQKRHPFPDSDGVRESAETITHANFAEFFSKYVAGTEEIPWNDFFLFVGLRVIETTATIADLGFTASRSFDGPMIVSAVAVGSEAERVGLQTGDNILEIDGNPPGLESSETAANLAPGDTVTVKVRSRRGTERELKWKVGSREELSYQLKDVEHLTAEQQTHRAAWLKGEAQTQ
jgi:predicted metalloprotease with PDZ domain